MYCLASGKDNSFCSGVSDCSDLALEQTNPLSKNAAASTRVVIWRLRERGWDVSCLVMEFILPNMDDLRAMDEMLPRQKNGFEAGGTPALQD